MSSDVRAWIGTLFRVVLAGILFWSGAAKLFEGSEAMNRAIVAYRLGLPLDLVHVIAWGLPILELVLGLLLLVGLLTRCGARHGAHHDRVHHRHRQRLDPRLQHRLRMLRRRG